jgi:hypothetical protein
MTTATSSTTAGRWFGWLSLLLTHLSLLFMLRFIFVAWFGAEQGMSKVFIFSCVFSLGMWVRHCPLFARRKL